MKSIVLVVVAFLAGCSAEDPVPEPSDDGLQPKDVMVSKDKGAISGVVIDATVRPLTNISVVTAGQEPAITDAGGRFTLTDLTPGMYFLDVSGKGFESVQVQTEVKAGEVSKMRVQLKAVPFVEPQHHTFVHAGYIQFNGGTSGPLLNIILDEMLGENPLCTCTLRFDTHGQDVKTIVVEASWTDTITLPTGPTDMYLEVFPAQLDDGTDDIQGGFLKSPILKHYPIELWGEDEENVEWRARLSGSGYYPQYDQSYDMFVTIFTNAPAPEGWSLIAGST